MSALLVFASSPTFLWVCAPLRFLLHSLWVCASSRLAHVSVQFGRGVRFDRAQVPFNSDVVSILTGPRAPFNSLALRLGGCLWQRQSAMQHVRYIYIYICIYIYIHTRTYTDIHRKFRGVSLACPLCGYSLLRLRVCGSALLFVTCFTPLCVCASFLFGPGPRSIRTWCLF